MNAADKNISVKESFTESGSTLPRYQDISTDKRTESAQKHILQNAHLRNFVRKIMPYRMRAFLAPYLLKKVNNSLKNEILTYYKLNNDAICQKELEYIKKNGPVTFPYAYTNRYRPNDIKVYQDRRSGLHYVTHEGKKLFFPRDMQKWKIKSCYSALLREQDKLSPHRYRTHRVDSFAQDGIFCDVGSAEGILALEYIETVKKVFLFEVEERWIEALKCTFGPWKEKVSIVNKYVSNQDDENNCICKLDTVLDGFENENVLIKMDIEGEELRGLEGAFNFLCNCSNVMLLCCTYHRVDDAENIEGFFKKLKFKYEFTDGYMLFGLIDGYIPPYFRKALIRAWNGETVE